MDHRRPTAVLAAFTLGVTALWPAPAKASPAEESPIFTAAQPTRLAQSSLLLSIVTVGKRLVAVGERGHILLSDDNGASWRQAKVPTSSALTAVRFATPETGWAVGHFGVILHTADGGETWRRQLDGLQAVQLTKAAADASGSPKRIARAAQWVADGPDKPLFALAVLDERTVFAFGAYGLSYKTEDGGDTWKAVDERLENPGALHVNAAMVTDGQIILAGEQGMVLRSRDGGGSFQALEFPYEGSLFDAVPGRNGDLVVIGLRGHAYRSADGGDTWSACARPAEETLMGGTVLPDGRYALVTTGGHLLVGDPACGAFTATHVPGAGPLAAVTLRSDRALALVGAAGYTQFSVPQSSEAGK